MGCMRSRWFVPALLVCLCAGVSRPALAQLDSLQADFRGQLTRHGVVGGGIAVIHAGAPATEFFFGKARSDTHQSVDAETTYNWASITKTMTAIAILQLRDRGMLSIDDSAVRYVPEMHQVHDAFGPVDRITIRDLLTHSAGFRNPTWPWDCDDASNCDWQPFEPTKWSQVAAMLPYTHVAFAPGSRWSYSNLGYVFLGQIIERLTGEDYEVYITKNILMPLGMSRSYFDRSPYFLERNVSASYIRSGNGLAQQPFDFDTGVTTSNSGLKAPIPDMEKFARFLIGDGSNINYSTVLKRTSLEEAWSGVLPATEPGVTATSYTSGPAGSHLMMGLGFFVIEAEGHRYIYHDGDQGGFSSEFLIDPEGRSASILAVNTTDTGAPTKQSSHPISNTEPNPRADLRVALRDELIDRFFPELGKPSNGSAK